MTTQHTGILATLNEQQIAKARRYARRFRLTIDKAAHVLYGKKKGVAS